jgi:uncharacterized protein YllA (UPF0747 family)
MCAWDPSPDAIKDQDYQIEALNTLMSKYNENMEQKSDFFNKMVKEKINENTDGKEKKLREALAKRVQERKNERGAK